MADLRELRRYLRNDFYIGDEYRYRDYLLTRDETHLTATNAAGFHRVRCSVAYAAAVDTLLERLASGAKPATRGEIKPKSKSGYHGVFYDARGPLRPWRAVLRGGAMEKYIGAYETAELAARAYDDFVITHRLDKALNFPDEVKQGAA